MDKPGFHRSLLDGIADGVYFVDRDRTILYWNPAAERITGYSAEEMTGRRCYDNILQHVDENGVRLCLAGCPLSHCMETQLPDEGEVFLRHKRGHRVPVRVKVSPTRDPDGVVTGAVEVFSDNSTTVAARNRMAKLERLAMIDPLTQMPNRRYLDARLSGELATLDQRGSRLGVMMIDVDNFKRINDEHGHQVGDEVLKVVAETLMANMRPQDTVGRWGGEEFLLIVHDVDEARMHAVAERLRTLIEASVYDHEGTPITVTVSVGLAVATDPSQASEAIRKADEAMYLSKRRGKNRVTAFPAKDAARPKTA